MGISPGGSREICGFLLEAHPVETVGFYIDNNRQEVLPVHMKRKMALLDFQKCRPETCDGGICAASLVCPLKLLQQESPYTIPVPEPSACRACGDCAMACPQKAIQLVNL